MDLNKINSEDLREKLEKRINSGHTDNKDGEIHPAEYKISYISGKAVCEKVGEYETKNF